MAYALITGGGKGIGRAITLELASKGYDILVVSRTEESLSRLCFEIKNSLTRDARYLVLDLAKEDSASTVFAWVQSQNVELEILVNNVGYGLSGIFAKQDITILTNMMQLNMQTLVKFTHIFLPMLKKRERSYILNIASTAAYQATPGLSTYAATKAFVLSFSRGLHNELRNASVSVTCVSPGPTKTAFFERAKLTKEGLERISKVQMQTQDVARIAIKALLNGKPEVIPGVQNKLTAFLSWLFPKKLVETIAGRLLKDVIE